MTRGRRRIAVENRVPLVDITSKLRDDRSADELHPDEEVAIGTGDSQ